MALNEAMKEAMRNAMAEDNPPRRGRSNQTTFRLMKNPGKSSHVLLARADGTLTKAGEFYYAENPSQPTPTSPFDYNTPLMKRGANDYIRTREGEALVRSLKVDGSVSLARLGRSYFKRKQTEYVVQVPVIVSGTNKRGNPVNGQTFLPTDLLGVG